MVKIKLESGSLVQTPLLQANPKGLFTVPYSNSLTELFIVKVTSRKGRILDINSLKEFFSKHYLGSATTEWYV